MKKKFVVISALTILTCVVFATIVTFMVFKNSKYSIDTKNFEMTIEYNGDLNLNDLTIYNKLLNREVLVEDFMVVSCDSTDTIGEKVLVIKYKDQEFTVKFNVKYKVDFMVDGESVNQQFVTTSSEIVLPDNISKQGY